MTLVNKPLSVISSIVKNIKRVMAAEFSRELSAKVHAGASRLARLGFRMGSPLCYGLERLVVDEKSQQKGILASYFPAQNTPFSN
jgi:hypothetical protein